MDLEDGTQVILTDILGSGFIRESVPIESKNQAGKSEPAACRGRSVSSLFDGQWAQRDAALLPRHALFFCLIGSDGSFPWNGYQPWQPCYRGGAPAMLPRCLQKRIHYQEYETAATA